MNEPAYVLIHRDLRSQIVDGRLAPGQRLPTERELCEQHAVSRITMRHALEMLASEGLIERFRQRGTFVRAATPRRLPIVDKDFTGSIQAEAPEMTRQLLSRTDEHRPGPHVRSALDLPTKGHCLFAERLDVLAGQPVAFDRAHIPTQYAGSVDDRMLVRIDFLEAWLAAESIARGPSSQTIEAVAADRQTARRLAVEPASPVLFTTDLIHDNAGRPVALFESFYRGDRFRLISTGRP